MEQPVLLAQESDDHPDEVACMISFVPNFIEKEVDESQITLVEEVRPDPQDVPSYHEGDNLYIFIVDRSGSMTGSKMQTTNNALVLFLKSLALGSRFEIISFGCKFKKMSNQKDGFKYDDEVVDKANQQV